MNRRAEFQALLLFACLGLGLVVLGIGSLVNLILTLIG